MASETLLTAVEVAKMLNVTRQAIYLWTRQQRIPHVRLGSAVRFRLSDIEEWLQSKTCMDVE